MSNVKTFKLDGIDIPFEDGETVMDAALRAGEYIPHLCHNPDFPPHGSCRVCVVDVNGRHVCSCTLPAAENMDVDNSSDAIMDKRRTLLQMLFVEGNHFCPSCEKTGNCQLQGVAYYLDMHDNHFPHFFANREMDASHPDILIDHNRCIFCNLCVRASQEKDNKNVFAISGRGINKRLIINSKSGQLIDSDIDINDCATHICPTGAILIKRTAYQVPIGQRIYDHHKIDEVTLAEENKDHG